MRLPSKFSTVMLPSRRKFKIIIKGKTSEPMILYPTKLTFKCKCSKLSPTCETMENGIATTTFLQIYQRMSFTQPKWLKESIGSSHPTLGYLPNRMEAVFLRDLHTRVHSSSHRSQKVEATQVSINREMNGWTKRGLSTQWNILQPYKGRRF